jgi:hypothetical protein
MTKKSGCALFHTTCVSGFSSHTPRFRVTIAAYAMANMLPYISSGIDLDCHSVGTAISLHFQRATCESSRKEIACHITINGSAEGR